MRLQKYKVYFEFLVTKGTKLFSLVLDSRIV